MDEVALLRFDGSLESTIKNGVEMVGGFPIITNPVLIKPNICTNSDGTGHSVTDVKVVETLVNLILAENPKASIKLVESDSQSKYTHDAFKKFGYTRLQEAKTGDGFDIDLVNLSDGPLVSVDVNGLHYDTVEVHEILTKPHHYISVAIAKTHETAFLTSTIKNHFGLLPKKSKAAYHSKIHEIVVDLNKIVPPDLCIIDGRVGVEGWNGPTTRNLGVFIIGKNPVAVDATVARVMGFEINKIRHLVLAGEIGLGDLNPNILGESIESVMMNFNAPR